MICEFCGAEYADTMQICPYCNGENEGAAIKEQQRILNDYRKETDRVSSLPDKIANKAAKGVSLIILVIILLFFIALGIVWAVTRAQASFGAMIVCNVKGLV